MKTKTKQSSFGLTYKVFQMNLSLPEISAILDAICDRSSMADPFVLFGLTAKLKRVEMELKKKGKK